MILKPPIFNQTESEKRLSRHTLPGDLLKDTITVLVLTSENCWWCLFWDILANTLLQTFSFSDIALSQMVFSTTVSLGPWWPLPQISKKSWWNITPLSIDLGSKGLQKRCSETEDNDLPLTVPKVVGKMKNFEEISTEPIEYWFFCQIPRPASVDQLSEEIHSKQGTNKHCGVNKVIWKLESLEPLVN